MSMTPAEMREMAAKACDDEFAMRKSRMDSGDPNWGDPMAQGHKSVTAMHLAKAIRALPIPDTTAADDDEIVEAMLVAANDACNDDDGDHAGAMRAALAAARPMIATAADDALEKAREALERLSTAEVFTGEGVGWTHPEFAARIYFAREALAAIGAAKAKGGG